MKWIWGILLVISFATNLFAGPSEKTEPSLELYDPITISTPKYPSFETATKGHKDNILNHITLADIPRSSIQYEYEGIQGVIVKQTRRRIMSFGRRILRERYRETYMTDSEYLHSSEQMELSQEIHENGAWWLDRDWTDYLPPEKGGAPPIQIYKIGSTHNILKIGPFSLSNIGKISIDKFGFFDIRANDDFSQLEETNGPNNNDHDEMLTDRRPTRLLDIHIEPIQPKIRNETWYNNRYWKFKIRPAARIRFALDNIDYTGDFSMKILTEFYHRNLHYADFETIARYEPNTQETIVSLSFRFLTF